MEGKTYYTITNQAVTLEDLPTLTICWPLEVDTAGKKYMRIRYREDFTVDVKVSGSKNQTTTLQEEENVKTSFNVDMLFSEIWPKFAPELKQFARWNGKQCFKITSKWSG